MEFHEKLQSLRKGRGLTQEELAEALYVSRTAVSKWESGRGYPSIDSLKELSRFFSVTIDELIGTEELVTAAERERKAFIGKSVTLVCCALDILPAALPFIPVFGNGRGGAATLARLTGTGAWLRAVFAAVLAATALNGVCGVAIARLDEPIRSRRRLVTGLALTSLGSMVFALTRQPYACIVYVTLLVIKGALVIQSKSV